MTISRQSDHIPQGISDLISERVRIFLDAQGEKAFAPELYKTIIAEVEKAILTEAMSFCHGNQIQAAKILGINRNTLKRKLDLYKIKTSIKRR